MSEYQLSSQQDIQLKDLLNIFYQKITNQHPRRSILLNSFKKHQQSLVRNNNDIIVHHHKINKSPSLRKNTSFLSDNSSSHLWQLQEQQNFQSVYFDEVFSFGYISYLVLSGSQQIFQMIKSNIQLLTGKQMIHHKNILQFKKIGELFNSQIYLQQIVKIFRGFTKQFLRIITKAVFGNHQFIRQQLCPTKNQLSKLSDQFKQSAQNQKIFVGSYMNFIKIGYSKADNKYYSFPNKPSSHKNILKNVSSAVSLKKNNDSQSISKQISINKIGTLKNLMRRKALRTLQVLISQYDRDDIKLSDLECIKKKKITFESSKSQNKAGR